MFNFWFDASLSNIFWSRRSKCIMFYCAFHCFFVVHSAYAGFSNESELTIIRNGGNTEQETWNTKTLNSYNHNKNTYKLGGHYSYGKADEELNTRNWDL